MTTVLNDNAVEPRMHALVIGVGAYRYFSGGKKELKSHPLALRLRQLTSAPKSAEAVASWLTGKRTGEPVVPLGSLEMAVSYPTGKAKVEAATFNHVRDAFDKWRQRLDIHERNVGFFFFSGHAIQREVLALLLEDTGEEPDRFFDNTIDFNTTYEGMAKCKAKIQCYFVDSCRSVPQEMLELAQFRPRALIDPEWHRPRRDAPTIFATGYGEEAYGAVGQCSRFTSVLLRALNGLGAGPPKMGQWSVTTESIGPAVRRLLEWDVDSYSGCEQTSQSSGDTLGNPIHLIASPPQIPFRLGCEPTEALGVADLRLAEIATGRVAMKRGTPVGETWENEVRADKYSFEARFANGGFHNAASELFALPPSAEEYLVVRPK